MFREPLNFALQRTAAQAFGWYLVFLVLAFLTGAFTVFFYDAVTQTMADFATGVRIGAIFAPIFTFIVGVLVVWPRPKTVLNVLLVALSPVAAVFAGFLGGGIFLAYLTTRPVKVNVADVFQ